MTEGPNSHVCTHAHVYAVVVAHSFSLIFVLKFIKVGWSCDVYFANENTEDNRNQVIFLQKLESAVPIGP